MNTLILKSGVETNSTIKLTDCPMKQGEILEVVCRLFANGLTEGNRAIKAVGDEVKYNTEQVTEGALYCVSYRDGGFFVGLRESEDYEPKEGDWFYLMNFSKSNGDLTHDYFLDFPTLNTREHFLQELFLNGTVFLVVGYDNNTKKTFGLSGVGGSRVGIQGETNPYNIYRLTKKIGVGAELIARTDIEYTFRNEKQLFSSRISTKKDVESGCDENGTFSLLLFKQITLSDIIAYQATGKMGALFLGESIYTDINKAEYKKNIAFVPSTFHANINKRYILVPTINGIPIVNCSDTGRLMRFNPHRHYFNDGTYTTIYDQAGDKIGNIYACFVNPIESTDYAYTQLTTYSAEIENGDWFELANGQILTVEQDLSNIFASAYLAPILKDNTETAQTLSIDE